MNLVLVGAAIGLIASLVGHFFVPFTEEDFPIRLWHWLAFWTLTGAVFGALIYGVSR